MISLRSLRLSERLFCESVHNPRNPISDQSHIEIDQEAQPFVCKPQIGVKLLLVNRSDLSERFDFDDDFVLNDQVRAKSHLKASSFINHRNRLLRGNLEASLLQLARQNGYVNGFEQPWTQTHVDSIGCVNDLLCENILRHTTDSARKDAKIAKKE